MNSHPILLAEAMLSNPSQIAPTDARSLAASVLAPTLKQLGQKLRAARMDLEAARVEAWQVALEDDEAGDVDLQRAALEAQALAAKLGAKARVDRLTRSHHLEEDVPTNITTFCIDNLSEMKSKWIAQRGEEWDQAAEDEDSEEEDFDLSAFVSEKNKYGFRGVFRDSRLAKYYSQLQSNHEKHFLGLHDTVEQAARAWAKKYLEVYGEPPPSTQKRSRTKLKRARQELDEEAESEESDLKEPKVGSDTEECTPMSLKALRSLSSPIAQIDHCGEFVIESYASNTQLVAS